MTTNDNEVVDLNKKSQEERVVDFTELLGTIEGVDVKMKQLWKEIYENAISDRQNAFVMFCKLSRIAEEKSTEHAVHARSMAQFIERMAKANDQLIKLTELISQADPSAKPIDPNEIFDAIQKKR